MLNKVFWLSLIVVFGLIFMVTSLTKSQGDSSQQNNIASQQQAELEQWKHEVDAWNKQAQDKVAEINVSGQPIVQLPNTGPRN